jgi:hypothetical protein
MGSGVRKPKVALCAFIGAVLIMLVACGPGTGVSLRGIHEEYDFDSAPVINDALCETCHDIGSIVAATKDYDGQIGFSVHEPPERMPFGDCESCHRLDEPPVMTCNQSSCHDVVLPEGWVSGTVAGA